jgi:hypothetical protein
MYTLRVTGCPLEQAWAPFSLKVTANKENLYWTTVTAAGIHCIPRVKATRVNAWWDGVDDA